MRWGKEVCNVVTGTTEASGMQHARDDSSCIRLTTDRLIYTPPHRDTQLYNLKIYKNKMLGAEVTQNSIFKQSENVSNCSPLLESLTCKNNSMIFTLETILLFWFVFKAIVLHSLVSQI